VRSTGECHAAREQNFSPSASRFRFGLSTSAQQRRQYYLFVLEDTATGAIVGPAASPRAVGGFFSILVQLPNPRERSCTAAQI